MSEDESMEKAPKQKKTSGDQKCGPMFMAAEEKGYGIGLLCNYCTEELLLFRPVFEML